MLSNELSQDEKVIIENFKAKVKDEEEYRVHHSMLIFDASNTMRMALGESLSYKIMQEHEFIVEVKNTMTLETDRDHPPK